MTLKIILFHLLATLLFAFGCFYDAMYVHIPGMSGLVTPFGGKLKYLTYINAIVQTCYFAIALINDFRGTNEASPAEKPLIRRIKDHLFSSIAFPVSMFVGITFWAIYAVDRELILPKSLDAVFPGWLNHVMHSYIIVFSLIELVSSFRMYPNRKTALTTLITFMLCYVVWIHALYFRYGSWVYPILKVLNWPIRICFYITSLILVCSLYFCGEMLNSLVWSKEIEETVRSGKKKAK